MLQDQKNFIRTLHELDRLSIHHQAQFSPVEARCFALHADPHPQPADQMRAMLKQIDAAMPKMDFGTLNGLPNPNNGRRAHWYKIGKEYSRVVYIETAKLSYKQRVNWLDVAQQVGEIAQAFGADEIDITENDEHGFSMRIWWD